MKLLINLLCCFIPSIKIRKAIRAKIRQLAAPRERREQLLKDGCTIDGNIVVTANSIKFDMSNDTSAYFNIKEILVNEVYSLICKYDCIVIDIGMNCAAASLFFAAQKNVEKIYAFEPFKPTVSQAKKNLALNPELSKKIRVFEYGLGGKDATLEIPYSAEWSYRMSTTHAVSIEQNAQTETVTIKDATQSLAPILEENKGNHIIIKCDCEGAEFEIFERLDEAKLMDNVDIILMEYHFEKPDRLVKILTEAGFAVHIQRRQTKKLLLGYLYAVKIQNKQDCLPH
ncbi:MAG: FkbM family methyltransferase [Sedimentisphaerales bacterium]|jgi:FkbM family methyltransferase